MRRTRPTSSTSWSANFIASLPAEEVYHAAQERGFTWGAVRAPEALLDDAHLHDRGFWKQVEHPELGRSFVYPGEAAIYNGSPWRISRRAPLIGEHNIEIFCGELGLSRQRTRHAGGKSSDLEFDHLPQRCGKSGIHFS